MSGQKDQNDFLKWGLVVLVFAGSLAANYYYQAAVATPIRIIGWIVVFGVMLGISALTAQGKMAIGFAREARIELRKVVWPNRQETMQTTMLVVVLVLVMGLLLWGLDSILLWAVGLLTGQRG